VTAPDERLLTDVYRRRIRLLTPEPGVVIGALEDTAHHVRVTVISDARRVVSVRGEAVRLPWVTCPGAVAGLATLDGTELTTSLRQLRGAYSPAEHCTHLFDLAHLAIAHAARGHRERLYEVVVSDREQPMPAYLFRDGVKTLEWRVALGSIVAPPQFAGVGLAGGFLSWCDANLDEEGAEAAFVLRRASSMAAIAHMDFDAYRAAGEARLQPGVCFTAQPERMAVAFRTTGSQRDYTTTGDGMHLGFDDAAGRVAQRDGS
jgi:hypothetical protein